MNSEGPYTIIINIQIELDTIQRIQYNISRLLDLDQGELFMYFLASRSP